MITTVVFDLDDTLYDEVEYCKSGFTSVSEFLASMPEMPSAERLFNAFSLVKITKTNPTFYQGVVVQPSK